MNKKKNPFENLEFTLGYKFKELKLLEESIVHRSYAHEKYALRLKSNERLEFLGDAVLTLVISDLLMERFLGATEGELSKIRASIVNEEQLARLAIRFELGKSLLLGRGEEITKGRGKTSILADTYEAILAAIYLDGGYGAAYRIIQEHFSHILSKALKEDLCRDYKTTLQEEVQKHHKKNPSYYVIQESGPEHQKLFHVQVKLPHQSNPLAFGTGKSKKEAEQDAAKNALKILKEEKEF